MSGPAERTIPGHTVAVQTDLPFSGLTSFGGPFLSKFQVSQMQHPLLENMTFVDTTGVVCGENQPRNYDFTGVISWFAAKCDIILLLFDPQKLDISDEFEQIISSLQGYEDKIRVILNKADQVDNKQLRKVYGALMWSLGKVLSTPKAPRVYIGSFGDKPEHEAAAGHLALVQNHFMCEINRLERLSEKVSSSSCADKQLIKVREEAEEFIKIVRKELDVLTDSSVKAKAAFIELKKKYEDDKEQVEKIKADYKDACNDCSATNAKKENMKNEFLDRFALIGDCLSDTDYAVTTDVFLSDPMRLSCYCRTSVENFMTRWNKDEVLRRHYAEFNESSTMYRFGDELNT
ncbi:hypothetical protein ABFS83_08G125600 [Erythranthe nasuta]